MASAYEEAYLDAVTLNEIYDVIMQEAAEGVQEVVRPSLEQLKAAAASYKATYTSLASSITNFENILQRQKMIRDAYAGYTGDTSRGYNSIEEYVDNNKKVNSFYQSGIPELLYSTTLKFHELINNFLGQQVQTIFVYENSNGTPELYNINQEEILKYTYSDDLRLIARYNVTNRNFSSALREFAWQSVNESGIANLKTTYQQSMSRYRRSKVHRAMWLNPSKPPKWRVMRISSAGDINEAYATVVLQRQEEKFLNSGIENNIDIFMMDYVQHITNESGALSGDVTDGNMEYAIKSAGASVLGISQLIEIANKILQENFDDDTMKELKQELKDKVKERNVLEDSLESFIDDNLDSMIASVNKMYAET